MFELTPVAESLKKLREEGKEPVENSDEDMLAGSMGSEDFGYALFEGGYLKPKEWVCGEGLKKLEEAVELVEGFKKLVDALHHEW